MFCVRVSGVLDAPTADGGRVERLEYDFSEGEKQFNSYWDRLQHLYTSKAVPAAALAGCFPSTVVPEVYSRAAWSTHRLMSTTQWLLLMQHLEAADMSQLDWLHARQLSEQLKIPYETVSYR